MIALGALGAVIIALGCVGATLHVPGAESVGTVALVNIFVALLAVAGVCHLAAVALVLRRPPTRGTIWLVLAVAAATRVVPLLSPPFLSSDLYRYVWDGRVQQAGINPYRYIPADPALAGLRDPVIYPHINRRDYAPTIYPPMAQVIFRGIAAVSQSPRAIKVAMVLFEVLAVLCLIRLLALAGLPTARVLIYAWNPLASVGLRRQWPRRRRWRSRCHRRSPCSPAATPSQRFCRHRPRPPLSLVKFLPARHRTRPLASPANGCCRSPASWPPSAVLYACLQQCRHPCPRLPCQPMGDEEGLTSRAAASGCSPAWQEVDAAARR